MNFFGIESLDPFDSLFTDGLNGDELYPTDFYEEQVLLDAATEDSAYDLES